MDNSPNWLEMPPELYNIVFQFVERDSIDGQCNAIRLVCRTWRNIIGDRQCKDLYILRTFNTLDRFEFWDVINGILFLAEYSRWDLIKRVLTENISVIRMTNNVISALFACYYGADVLALYDTFTPGSTLKYYGNRGISMRAIVDMEKNGYVIHIGANSECEFNVIKRECIIGATCSRDVEFARWLAQRGVDKSILARVIMTPGMLTGFVDVAAFANERLPFVDGIADEVVKIVEATSDTYVFGYIRQFINMGGKMTVEDIESITRWLYWHNEEKYFRQFYYGCVHSLDYAGCHEFFRRSPTGDYVNLGRALLMISCDIPTTWAELHASIESSRDRKIFLELLRELSDSVVCGWWIAKIVKIQGANVTWE